MMKKELFLVVCVFSFAFTCAFGQTDNNDSMKLFTLLSPDFTGVKFSNNVKDNEVFNVLSHPNHWNGGGVAIGDINNDGLQDIFISGNEVGCKLYLNKGDLKFQDITMSAGVEALNGWNTGVTMADVNADGLLDIYVCRSGLNDSPPETLKNLLFINNGNLKFSEKATVFGLDDMGLSIHAAFFDYDRDGLLDIFVINNNHVFENGTHLFKTSNEGAGSNRLYHNMGNGKFVNATLTSGIIQKEALSLAVVCADINLDGWPDIYVTNDLKEPDYLFINNGNGTFTETGRSSFKHFSLNGMGCDIADFNNDALPDVIVADMYPEDPVKQKNQPGFANDYYDQRVREGYYHQLVRNTVQLNNGNGTFSDISQQSGLAHTDWSWATIFADFDNDGYKDVYVTNSLKRNIMDSDFAIFQMDSIMKNGNQETASKDLFYAFEKMPTLRLQNYIFKNNSDLTFSNKIKDWGFNQVTNSNGVAFGDLDNDGDIDLVVNNLDTVSFLYKNNSSELKHNNFLRIIPVNDIDKKTVIGTKAWVYYGDKKQYSELLNTRGYQSSSESVLHFGIDMAIASVDSLIIQWPDGSKQTLENVKSGEALKIKRSEASGINTAVSENQKETLFFEFGKKAGIDYKHLENNFNDFKREPLLIHKLSQEGPGICVADVNGDGLDDFFVGGATNFESALYLQQDVFFSPNGAFKKAANTPFSSDKISEDVGNIFADVNNDGFKDLIVIAGSNESSIENIYNPGFRCYKNDGKGNFTKSPDVFPAGLKDGSCIAATDFNEDGWIDVFIGGKAIPGSYPLCSNSYLFKNENGKFIDVSETVAPGLSKIGLVKSALWTDFDNDDKIDLIVLGEWMPLTFFKNENGKFVNITEKIGFTKTVGWWNSITGGDFDNDGDVDYIAGNIGLNTRFHASEKEPMCIYANDFDKNGTIDAVMCNYIKGRNTPVPDRDILLDQIISLKKKYINYKGFINKGVEDYFEIENVKNAPKLEAQLFESVYIENRGNNNFVISKLPSEAQTFPMHGIAVQDLNNDKNLDVIAVGNFFGYHSFAGRCDAGNGIVLKGDGKGSFKTLNITESGFYVPGNSKSLARIYSPKNEPVFLVGNNNDFMQAFAVSKYKLSGKKVELNPENRYVAYKFDNKIRKEEFYKGSGYLSQHSGKFFLPVYAESYTVK